MKEAVEKQLKAFFEAGENTKRRVEHTMKALCRHIKKCLDLPHPPTQHSIGIIGQEIWALEKALGLHSEYVSQAGQDKYVYEKFFTDQRKGVFIEIGGHDGVTGSNCWFFEKILGWSGVIVEAAPSKFPLIKANHRSVDIIHAAIGKQSGEAEFFDVIEGYHQMSSLISACPQSRQDWLKLHPQHRGEVVSVPVKTLCELMSECNLSRADYCSIDVEGAELEILQGFDFDAAEIEVFSIENADASNTAIRELMTQHEYQLEAIVGYDEIYRKRL